jgi:N-acetylglucosamine kinase-like BadF-type ATPase
MCVIGIHGTSMHSTGIMLGSDGRLVAIAFGGAFHPHEYSEAQNHTSLQGLINQLVNKAEYPPISEQNCTRICVACPGMRSEIDKQRLGSILAAGELAGIQRIIVLDATATLVAGSLENEGVAITVGSGSVAYGRDKLGGEWQAGGWGSSFGDEGSGYAIANATLNAVARANDGRDVPCPVLVDCLLKRLGLSDLSQLIGWVDSLHSLSSRIKISSIVPAVIEAYEHSGDLTARRILDEATDYLYETFHAVSKRLDWDERYNVILEGGVIENSNYIAGKLRELITNADPRADIRFPQYRAVVAAGLFALFGESRIMNSVASNRLFSDIDSLPNTQRDLLVGPMISERFSK